MKCTICNKDQKLICHHLSYEPEIIIDVCHGCHWLMHRLAIMPQDQQDIILDYIRKYSDQWENGREKYHKSEHSKNRVKEYQKTDKYQNCKKRYAESNRAKNKQKEYEKSDKIKKHRKEYYLKNKKLGKFPGKNMGD